ncbi:MAG: tRNA (guanosine(37)-N1)-methyltransferase TrmD [Candidatus Paceibacterota bacterium]
MINFHIITVFPELVTGYLTESIIARAIASGKIGVEVYNLRDFTTCKHGRVDDRPYGPGPGMLLMAEPVLLATEAITAKLPTEARVKILITAPAGSQLTNKLAGSWVKDYTDIIIIAGRYEGLDARVKDILGAEEISIGAYILTGGELPALVMLDVAARHIPGVLGNELSLEENRVASSDSYTRPEVLIYKGKEYGVPKVLLSGHHKNIDEWRQGRNAN